MSARSSASGGADPAFFLKPSTQVRQVGNSPTHNPPKGGCVVGERHSPPPMHPAGADDRAKWVRANLPECAAVAASFKAEFGEVRMTFASENGNEVGKRSPEPVDAQRFESPSAGCDGCRWLRISNLSPTGNRKHRACIRYRIAEKRCVDWEAAR